MKLQKITGIIILFIVCALDINAQDVQSSCYDPYWNWMEGENWKIYWTSAQRNPDGSYMHEPADPFQYGEMSGIIRGIEITDDLDPINGWVLLRKHLGCTDFPVAKPHVIFYNRFRGIIRIMGKQKDQTATNGLVTAEWYSGASSALSFANGHAYANDKYPNRSNDLGMNVVEAFSMGKWWVADFEIAFDHTTTKNLGTQILNFKTYAINEGELKTSSAVELKSENITIKGGQKVTSNDNTKLNWAVEGKKAIKNLRYDEWENYLKEANNTAKSVYNAAIDISFDKVFTSTLKRTHETAVHFLEKGIPWQQLSGLDEMHYGDYEGNPILDSKNGILTVRNAWAAGQTDTPMTNGESPEDVAKRQKEAIDEILSQDIETVLVVMHGRALKILMCEAENKPLSAMDTFPMPNSCLYVLEYDYDRKSFECKIAANTDHLDEVKLDIRK